MPKFALKLASAANLLNKNTRNYNCIFAPTWENSLHKSTFTSNAKLYLRGKRLALLISATSAKTALSDAALSPR
jgi:hypothetical protein